MKAGRGRRSRWSSSACTCRCSPATCSPASRSVAPLLATAIPLGIYNFTEAMNNVESASAAGDNYNLRKILLADGIGAIVGSMLGSPFPPAVYIGHPGWKAVGGRIGYSLATGVVHRAGLLPRAHRAAAERDSAGGDPADPALHRPGHRRAGVPGQPGEARAGGGAGHHSEHRRVGQDQHRRCARRGRHLRRRRSAWRKLADERRRLPAACDRSAAARCWRAWCWVRWPPSSSSASCARPRSLAFIGAALAFIGLIHGAAARAGGASPMVALGYALFGVDLPAESRRRRTPRSALDGPALSGPHDMRAGLAAQGARAGWAGW